jgi:hypothetical protein
VQNPFDFVNGQSRRLKKHEPKTASNPLNGTAPNGKRGHVPAHQGNRRANVLAGLSKHRIAEVEATDFFGRNAGGYFLQDDARPAGKIEHTAFEARDSPNQLARIGPEK